MNAAHLIRAAFNVKSDAPGVVFLSSLSLGALRDTQLQTGVVRAANNASMVSMLNYAGSGLSSKDRGEFVIFFFLRLENNTLFNSFGETFERSRTEEFRSDLHAFKVFISREEYALRFEMKFYGAPCSTRLVGNSPLIVATRQTKYLARQLFATPFGYQSTELNSGIWINPRR